jgi:1,2-diacylglycerol 3-alpha-glucosyltransferase
LRRELGIAESDIVIFTGGKLEPWKRTELLIEAVRSLPSLPLQLIVAGESGEKHGDYKKALVEMSRAQPNIRFVGWLKPEGIYKHLDMADMAVFPASQSILWQQAIAMGLPLVVGNAGNQDMSYLNLHDNIVILEKQDIRSDRLAQEVERIASDPARMRTMSAGAARVADDCLNWDKLVQRTLQFNLPATAVSGACKP